MSILTRVPNSAEEKQPHSVILPSAPWIMSCTGFAPNIKAEEFQPLSHQTIT